MKTSHLFFILLAIVLCFSCGKNNNNSYPEYGYNENSPEAFQNNDIERVSNQQTSSYKNTKSKGLKAYNVMNKQFGIPVGAMPIPTSWNKSSNTQENVLFEGPKGVKIYGEQFKSYYYSTNQQQNQYAQQRGSDVKPIKNIDRLIHEDIKPLLEAQGIRFVRQYPLPQLAQFDKQFDSYIFKATPENKQFQCMVTEWVDQHGNPSMAIIRYFIAQYTTIGGIDWGFTYNAMKAPKDLYENTKNALINSLVNFKINPQWVQANNQYWSQMAQQSNAGHQQRMAAIQAQGQQILANGRARSQAMDNQYNAWRDGQAASDRTQASYIDGIYERQVVTNTNTGQQYKVEGYDSNVWMNNNNEYISNNNSLYNPNTDNTMNNENWTQLETNDNW